MQYLGGKSQIAKRFSHVYCEDYRSINIPSNSLVYCDPPYKNVTKYKGIEFEHREFYDWIIHTYTKDITVLVSELSTADYLPSDRIIWKTSKTIKVDSFSESVDKSQEECIYCFD